MGISKSLFNQTLTLQTATETADGMGGITKTWANAGSFKARISSLTSKERLLQDKQTPMATHRIFCDNFDVSFTDRIKWGDYYFEITGIINPSEMYHHLEIEVREMTNG